MQIATFRRSRNEDASGTVLRREDLPARMARGLICTAVLALGGWGPGGPAAEAQVFEEFCLRGELDLGARLQGTRPSAGEWYPTRWCVVTSPESERVRFSAAGHSNPDMEGDFTVSYLSGDRVRLVNAGSPPDVEFRGTLAADEARALRRMDPNRLVTELERHPEWVVAEREGGWRDVRWPGGEAVAAVQIQDGRLRRVETVADMPLRGRVPVISEWTWSGRSPEGELRLVVDGGVVFRADGARRRLEGAEADGLWEPSGGVSPVEVPGRAWPATVDLRTETLSPGVHIVRGVRTGFHHLVVETEQGLVVADAPAGWVELQQVPPRDLVPGLGISGLSERFVDYLGSQWPGVPIRAVALTHAHDDHAGGARAFAAAGAEIYAPADVADFIERALTRGSMPDDRYARASSPLRVIPVDEAVVLPDPHRPVELLSLDGSPHVDAALGVYLPWADVFFQSDLHVPGSDAPTPREDRLAVECWFAAWAVRRLPPRTLVHNSHNAQATAVGRLGLYLEHEGCASPMGATGTSGSRSSPLFVSVEGAATEARGVSRGAAWGDVDGDGFPELVVTRPGGPPQAEGAILFRNEGGTLVRGGPLPVPRADWEAPSWVDLDGDGDLDLAMVGRRGAGAVFLENQGPLGFAPAPDLFAGLVTSATMMCWADADGDGLLDAFVVGYGDEANRLFRGVGPWTMEPAGLPDAALVGGASRACAWADLNEDRLPELVVANARMPNLLLRNGGSLRFSADTSTALSSDRSYSYGVSVADFDGDGALDVFVANFDAPNALLRGVAGGGLDPVPEAPESAASKGHAWGDFDLDGRLDLYLGSGTPAPGMLNELYLRRADGGFRAVDDGVVGEHADTSAAVAAADMDGDGDLDLFVANWGSPGSVDRLYRNTATGSSWIKISLSSPSSGIGARVSLTWTEDGRSRTGHRWVTASTGYAGQNDATVHFGLGDAAVVDELEVRWPSGCTARARGVAARQTLVLSDGDCGSMGGAGPS